MLNRSFNGPERGSPASPSLPQRQKLRQPPHPRGRTLGAVIKEKDEELALFLEMRKREKERQNSLLLNNTSADELDHLPDSKPGSSPIFKIASSAPTRRAGADDFLNSDNNKNDYDWLLTPPGTPLFPSLEKEVQRSPVGRMATPKTRPTALKSRLADPQEQPARVGVASRQGIGSTGTGMGGIRRPSSSGGPGSASSRPATPTGRLMQSVASRPARSSTPTPRLTTTSSAKPAAPVAGAAARRSSTPTSRSSSLSSSAPSSNGAGGRSFLPARSSTPTRRASAGAALAGTPTRSSAPSSTSSMSSSTSAVATTTISRSVVVAPAAGKKSAAQSPVRGVSPTVRSRPWKPSEMPGFSLDAPPNLRTTLPERPSSASRGRPGGARSASVDAAGSAPGSGVPRGRRQSCSPSRGRTPVPNGGGAAVSTTARSRSSVGSGNGSGEDGISPVLIGSKMVERVVNLRRLAPPKRDERGSLTSSSSSSRSGGAAGGKPLSAPSESSGFGRNLSKKSLDMAMRHMDIRRSIPSSLRPLMTNVPASSMYSVRSGVTGRSRGVADSPLATSSNASSSELSLGNPRCLYASSEADDDAKDVAARSPVSSFSAAPPT